MNSKPNPNKTTPQFTYAQLAQKAKNSTSSASPQPQLAKPSQSKTEKPPSQPKKPQPPTASNGNGSQPEPIPNAWVKKPVISASKGSGVQFPTRQPSTGGAPSIQFGSINQTTTDNDSPSDPIVSGKDSLKEAPTQQQEQPAVGMKSTKPVFGSSNTKNSEGSKAFKPQPEAIPQNITIPANIEPKPFQQSPRPHPILSPNASYSPHPLQPQEFSPRQGHMPHPSSQPHIRPHHYPNSPMSGPIVPGSPSMTGSPIMPPAFSPQQRPRDQPMHSPIQPSMSPTMAQYPYQYPGYQPQYDPNNQQGFYRPVYTVPYPVPPHIPVMQPGVQPRMNTGAPTFVPPQSNRAIKIVNPKTGGVVDLKGSPPVGNKELPVTSTSIPNNEEKNGKEEKISEPKKDFTLPKKNPSKAIPIINPAMKESEDSINTSNISETLTTPKSDEVKTPEIGDKPIPTVEEDQVKSTSPINEISDDSVKDEKKMDDALPEDNLASKTSKVSQLLDSQASKVEEKTITEDTVKEDIVVPSTIEESEKDDAVVPNVIEETKADDVVVPNVTEETQKDDVAEKKDDVTDTKISNNESTTPQANIVEDTKEESSKEPSKSVSSNIEEQAKPSENGSDSKPTDTSNSVPASVLNPDQLNQVPYPPNINAPKSIANSGTLKYDTSFLLQFKDVCKDRPNNMPTLESLGIEENSRDDKRSSSSAGRRGGRGGSSGPRGANTFQGGDMGSFKHTPKTSEERFAASQGAGGRGFNRGSMGGRSASGSNNMPNMGSREGRGSRSGRHKGKGDRQQQGGPTIPLDEVAPLAFSKERWVPNANVASSTDEENNKKEILCRKVKGLLNKLTLEKFESISDKIIDFANQATEEKNGSTLQTIIQLVFEKATDEPNFIMVYASLCRKMMDKISPDVMDESIRGKDNKPVSGGALFRKYLLSRCQEEFEKGWKVDLADGASLDNPNALLTDEYYVAAKAKRRGLGLMAFIGELFKLQMLTERIMHECIKRLLSNVQTPEEEETESLCKLMSTVGKQLDRKEAKNYMDAYFQRMKEMSVNKNLNSRIRFMILDVIDLRSNKWIPRREVAGPKTISQIHQDAQKQKEETAEMLKKTASSGGRLPHMNQQLSRSNSGRRDRRGPPGQGPDGWNTVGNAPSSRKTGDLTAFGNLARSKSGANVSLGPGGGVFGALGGGSKGWKTVDGKPKEEPKPSSGNMFSALMSSESPKKDDKSFERKPLNLRPRSVLETPPEPVKLTKEEVESKIKAMVEEYLSVKDVPEVTTCIKELDSSESHSMVVSEFINEAIDKKKADIDAVIKLFKILSSEDVINRESFVAGILEVMEYLEDIAIDVPQAYEHLALMMSGAPIELEDLPKILETLLSGSGSNPPANKVLGNYLKALSSDIGPEKLTEKFQKSGLEWSQVLPKHQHSEDKIEEFMKKYDLEIVPKSD
ncbi:hypothetical protein K7432_012422 [Basidiobolus ranarum]|uniref:MI domain-containing protein n=1 Tax=Basidiobolus ranarum TaxID=34480 RepID=A0ABR2VT47_9FUNG